MGSFGMPARLGLGALLFVAGYSFCRYVNSDERYSLLRRKGDPYLYDGSQDQDLRIYEKEFQVGSLEYRLEGVLRDRRLPSMLKKLSTGEKDG